MSNFLILIVFFIFLLPGLAGAFLPLPGLLYMFIISLVYGFVDGFIHITSGEIIALGVITVIGISNDYLTGMIGAKYGGASAKSMLFGIIGMVIGVIILPPFGGLAGVFLGILIAEVMEGKNKEKAVRAATGGLLGSIAGMIITLILAVIFLFLFIIFAIK